MKRNSSTRGWVARAAAAWAASVFWSGCSGGQSGNEGTSPASGVCIAGGDHWIVRLAIHDIDRDSVEGEILSVEKTPTQPSPLEVGDVIRAFWTTSQEFDPPGAGDQVLARYHDQLRGQFLLCDDLAQCWSEKCGGAPVAPDEKSFDSCQSTCYEDHREECGFEPFFYMLPLKGDDVVVELDSATHTYSVEDILSADCDDSAFARRSWSDTR